MQLIAVRTNSARKHSIYIYSNESYTVCNLYIVGWRVQYDPILTIVHHIFGKTPLKMNPFMTRKKKSPHHLPFFLRNRFKGGLAFGLQPLKKRPHLWFQSVSHKGYVTFQGPCQSNISEFPLLQNMYQKLWYFFSGISIFCLCLCFERIFCIVGENCLGP